MAEKKGNLNSKHRIPNRILRPKHSCKSELLQTIIIIALLFWILNMATAFSSSFFHIEATSYHSFTTSFFSVICFTFFTLHWVKCCTGICVCFFCCGCCCFAKARKHRFNISSMNLRVKTSPAKQRYGWTVKIAIRFYNKRTHLIIFFWLWMVCLCWSALDPIYATSLYAETKQNDEQAHWYQWIVGRKKCHPFFHFDFFYSRLLKEREKDGMEGMFCFHHSLYDLGIFFVSLSLSLPKRKANTSISVIILYYLPFVSLFMCIPSLHETLLDTLIAKVGISFCYFWKCCNRLPYVGNWLTKNQNWVEFWTE